MNRADDLEKLRVQLWEELDARPEAPRDVAALSRELRAVLAEIDSLPAKPEEVTGGEAVGVADFATYAATRSTKATG